MTKYEALGSYLNHSDALQITLSFKDVERILDFKLPDTAKTHRDWWANKRMNSSRQCDSWLGAGWQVFFADLHRQEVTFIRYQIARAAAAK